MKKLINEPEYIGGQGSLNREEEIALSKYFTERKMKSTAKTAERQIVNSRRQTITQ